MMVVVVVAIDRIRVTEGSPILCNGLTTVTPVFGLYQNVSPHFFFISLNRLIQYRMCWSLQRQAIIFRVEYLTIDRAVNQDD